MTELTNEEIFAKLKSLGMNPGPVTDSTRSIYLKKLNKIESQTKLGKVSAQGDDFTDNQIRAALSLHGQEPGPITSPEVRKVYVKKLHKIEKNSSLEPVEPMLVDDDL